jgi:hypothetical protein
MASISKPPHEKCPRCGSGLVRLEWHERVNARELCDLWHCWNCKIVTVTEPFFTSLLV